LLTVLIVMTSATIAAMLLRVVVSAASSQQQRRSAEVATRTAQEIEGRVRNQLAQDPFAIFDTVLADEAPRICDADLVNHPQPITAGSAWPATCGSLWSYAGTGGLEKGARVLVRPNNTTTLRLEVFARSGAQQVGYITNFTAGGPSRPLLYTAGDANLDVLRNGAGSISVDAPSYVGGVLTPGAASFDDDVTISAEGGFTALPSAGMPAVPSGIDGGEQPYDIRTLYPVRLARTNIGSSLIALRHIACLDPSPTNVGTSSSSLCLIAGGDVRLRDNTLVTLPDGAAAYVAWLILPLGDDMVRIYGRTTTPVAYPAELASWTLVGDANIPASGVLTTDADTVIGHCDETMGVCTDWAGDEQPGVTISNQLTVVVGSLTAPADLHIGGPINQGSGRLGVVVSGRVLVPSGATPAAGTLNVNLWVAVVGSGAASSLASSGPASRPSLVWVGAVLLEDFTVTLDAFNATSFTIPADRQSPPLFPVPGVRLLPTSSASLSTIDVDALFTQGDALPE
jgi:hypothetical protein